MGDGQRPTERRAVLGTAARGHAGQHVRRHPVRAEPGEDVRERFREARCPEDAVHGRRGDAREERGEVRGDDDLLPGVHRGAGHHAPSGHEPVGGVVHRQGDQQLVEEGPLGPPEQVHRLLEQPRDATGTRHPPVAVVVERAGRPRVPVPGPRVGEPEQSAERDPERPGQLRQGVDEQGAGGVRTGPDGGGAAGEHPDRTTRGADPVQFGEPGIVGEHGGELPRCVLRRPRVRAEGRVDREPDDGALDPEHRPSGGGQFVGRPPLGGEERVGERRGDLGEGRGVPGGPVGASVRRRARSAPSRSGRVVLLVLRAPG
ncbi:hypothetical protein Cus16_0565 [Curtobacterium sp. ER1/6]|nr:hypothetical protein Cus16_0565 [Curtobacterium sp. ER1/6]